MKPSVLAGGQDRRAALQARQFSWDATAGAMLRTYERARWQLRAEASA